MRISAKWRALIPGCFSLSTKLTPELMHTGSLGNRDEIDSQDTAKITRVGKAHFCDATRAERDEAVLHGLGETASLSLVRERH